MIGLKKFVSNELLQLALLLSIIRHRNDNLINNNFEYESPTVGVGGRSNNEHEWNHTNVLIQHNPIHPKSIVNYQEELIHELNALGRYNRIDFTSDVTAYLLNINGTEDLPSIGENSSVLLPSQPSQSSTIHNGNGETDVEAKVAELSKEDMAIIEMLWKQDTEREFNLHDSSDRSATASGPGEMLVVATSSNDTDPDPSSSVTEQTFEDLNAFQSVPDDSLRDLKADPCTIPSPSSSKSICVKNEDELDSDFIFPNNFDDLYTNAKKSYFSFETGEFGVDFKNEFKNEEEPDLLLVADEPPHDLFRDEYLINNALQLCDLNDCCSQGASSNFSSTDSKFEEKKEENKKSDDLLKQNFELDLFFEMMQTAQYHHSARSFHPSRVPYVRSALGIPGDQRWQDFANNFMTDQNVSYSHHHSHPHSGHHLHHNYSTNVTSSYHMGSAYHPHHHDSGAIIHNATLPPPIGDLNNTSPYHIGTSPNVGSAVSSSMNLTNCDSESSMAHTGAASYKMDNDSIYYQHNATNQSLNNQTESFFPSILNDEDLQLMDMAMNESMYGNMLDNVTSNASNNLTTPLAPPERCTDSDSAVSSMGSERVPSLSSDNEWMETNSDSGHTPGDHYSADYSKYRWYDNYMYTLRSHSMSENSTGSPSRIPPVAQKKYHLYGKRLFHDHNSTGASTSSDLNSTDSAIANIKYEMNEPDSRLMEPSCSSKSYNSSSESKYSCSSDFSRQSHRPSFSELVSHNHSYTMAPDNIGTSTRNYIKDKTAKYIEKLKMVDFAVRKSEEEQMTRDEKKARALDIPIPVYDIINLPMDEFNERLSKYDLSETQLSLIRDIRRRGKNKVAAQNCRKRKLDQIISLADEVKQMKDKKRHLLQQHEYLSQESVRVKNQFSQLYKHVFNALRDSDGNPYSPFEFSLEQTTDGNVELVRRHQVGHSIPSSSKDPSTSSSSSSMDSSSHHYSNRSKKDFHEHRKD